VQTTATVTALCKQLQHCEVFSWLCTCSVPQFRSLLGCNKMTSCLHLIQPCDTSDHTVCMSANTEHDIVSYCVDIQCLHLMSVQNRAAKLVFKCKACSTVKTMIGKPGLGKITCPKACDSITVEGSGNLCGRDPFFIDDRKCKFVDHQILKLQVTLHTSSTMM